MNRDFEMEIDESEANEPTSLCYLDAGKSKRMGPNTIDDGMLCLLSGGCWCVALVAGWAVAVVVKARRRRTPARTFFTCFKHFFKSSRTERRERERNQPREQACRTTARNYFGDNLPVSILRGRFGRPLRENRGPAAISASTKGPGPGADPLSQPGPFVIARAGIYLSHHSGSIDSLTLPFSFLSFHHAPQNSTRTRSIWCRWG